MRQQINLSKHFTQIDDYPACLKLRFSNDREVIGRVLKSKILYIIRSEKA